MKISDIKKGNHIFFYNSMLNDFCDGEVLNIKKRKHMVNVEVSYKCIYQGHELTPKKTLVIPFDKEGNLELPQKDPMAPGGIYIGEDRTNFAKAQIEGCKQRKHEIIKKLNGRINNFKRILNYD